MIPTSRYRDGAAGLADLLNFAAVVDDGVVLNKDGSLMAGWFYQGDDISSSTDDELNARSARLNSALARLGSGWMTHHDAIRFEAKDYPSADRSHFPDAVSSMIDAERRSQFQAEGTHFESRYALVVTYLPPLAGTQKLADYMFDDDARQSASAQGTKVLEGFNHRLAELEDGLSAVLRIRRMRGVRYVDACGTEHVNDELLQYLNYATTGENHLVNLPPVPMYLDAVIGGRELWAGITPKVGENFVSVVAIDGFPLESTPAILASLDRLPIAYRWSTRFLYMDAEEARGHLVRYRRKWQQKTRGFVDQVLRTNRSGIDQDAVSMVDETEAALADASSQLVTFGYYTSGIVLLNPSRTVLQEAAREVRRELQNLGFGCRVETVNALEAWLGSIPGHSLPNIRRPMMHTMHLADMLPTSSIWPGHDACPCAFYPPDSPPLLHAATEGATPFRLNLHVGDLGHTLVFGPTGAGKSTLLGLIVAQFLRYEGASIFAFDKGNSLFALTRACGGQHYEIGSDGTVARLFPLSEIDSDSDQAWAEEWIETCAAIQLGDGKISPLHRNAIHVAMQLQRSAPRTCRTLTNFVTNLQNSELKQALEYYTNQRSFDDHPTLRRGDRTDRRIHLRQHGYEQQPGAGRGQLARGWTVVSHRFENNPPHRGRHPPHSGDRPETLTMALLSQASPAPQMGLAAEVTDEVFWLGQKLVADGKISREQMTEAIRSHRARGGSGPFSETLEMLQLVNPQRVAQLVGERHRLPFLLKVPVERSLARRVSAAKARARLFVPFQQEADRLHIAVAEPELYGRSQASIDFPEAADFRFHVTPRKEVLAAVESAWSEPVVVSDPAQFVEKLLLEVVELKASDVHFEPKEHTLQIRRRVDGVLSLHANVSERDRAGVIRALKIKARMDIAEHRLPQDGMFKLVVGARRYTFRASTLPVVYGEKVQLRIGDDNQTERSFRDLGMDGEQIALLNEIMKSPHGAVLVTGPTGSGKSTLLFAAIATLPLTEVNAVSLEEPVEFAIPGINQVSINTGIGLTFASSLRHVLRQDPDVIIVGEMRDLETATLAIRAALTGHLCLATLHTNDACGAITRLIDMGIEPFLVSGAVRAVVAQRLVKRLCGCKRLSPHNAELKRMYGIRSGEVYEPRAGGCAHCRGTGYDGRVGIFEFVALRHHGQEADDHLRGIINGMKRKDSPTTEADLLAAVRTLGTRTLREDGLLKVAAGITSLEEVLSET